MGIARITYLFDIDNFRGVFEPISRQLYQGKTYELREKAHHLVSRNLILWKLLDQLGYRKDDFGKEEEEFEDIEHIVKFWILALISSFCKDTSSIPLDSLSIANLLREFNIEDEETIRKLQWGRPLGGLLLPQIEIKPALDRDDSKWPYWCKSYGSLGWLEGSDIDSYLDIIKRGFYKARMTSEKRQLDILQSILQEAENKSIGLFLGESA